MAALKQKGQKPSNTIITGFTQTMQTKTKGAMSPSSGIYGITGSLE